MFSTFGNAFCILTDSFNFACTTEQTCIFGKRTARERTACIDDLTVKRDDFKAIGIFSCDIGGTVDIFGDNDFAEKIFKDIFVSIITGTEI